MKNSKFFANLLIVFFFVATLTASFLALQRSEKPTLFVSKQQSTLNLDKKILNYVNMGQKRLISSLLWVATIIESDHDHYKGKDLNSWMYLRFSSISELEPQFYETYAFGGPYLSVVKDDLEGASIIFRKGLSVYPDDYNLLNKASFHFYLELRDTEESYKIFKKLNQFPKSSPLVKTSLGRIEADKGNLESAFNILTELSSKFKEEDFIKKKIDEFRYSIKAENDLNCLNTKKVTCDFKDLKNNPYILFNGKYSAQEKWIPYRPKWIKK